MTTFHATLRWGLAWSLALGALFSTGCGDGPVEPALPALEILVAGGDGQFGAPGQRLGEALRVLVRRADTQAPQSGVAVTWEVASGSASLVTASVGSTDGTGVAQATLQLGATPGAVTVRATVRDQPAAAVTFNAVAADRPQLQSVTPAAARGGDTLTVRGAGFSATPDQNVVLFSGIRGRVVSASPTELRVLVPACLPPRRAQVTVQLGSLVSSALGVDVSDGGTSTTLEEGIPLDVDDAGGFTCLRLPGGGRYLVTVQSTGSVGAARYGFSLSGLASSPSVTAPARGGASPALAGEDVANAFESALRLREDHLVRAGGAAAPAGPWQAAEPVVPTVGTSRAFKVLNGQGQFDDVKATARLVSAQAVLYVDDTAPGGGFTDGDLQAFAETFDAVIHPTVSGAFGAASDLDGNERVAILFTPTVNRLTPAGSEGFIGGFFYGLDLLDREGSNRGEIFYAMVPDSAGRYSDPRPRDLVLRVTPAILAHEFQHMVHFNERVLKLGAEGTEALWLSEGMAQMAEELVALELIARRQFGAVEAYREGNRTRARRYLADPGAVSLLVATGQGSLAERGAGWLHTLYLWDRLGKEGVLARLTQTTRTGIANVEAATGASWRDVFSDWAAALYVDGLSTRKYPFEYPAVELRSLLRTPSDYPLVPETLSGDFTRSGSLWSSSVRHYIVVPPSTGYVALRLGGEAGGNAPADAAFRLRVVRLY